MDRGGRGRGGSDSSGQGSSLPRTLHGSLLQPGTQEPTVVLEPQPMTEAESAHLGNIPYAAQSSRSARTASLHPPSLAPTAFEEGSSRDVGGGGITRSHTTSFERALPIGQGRFQDAHLDLPPIQITPNVSSTTDPARFAPPRHAHARYTPGYPGYTHNTYPPPRPQSVRPPHPGPSAGDPRYHTSPAPQLPRSWLTNPVERATSLHQQPYFWSNQAQYVPDTADFQPLYAGEVLASERVWAQEPQQEEIPSDHGRNTTSHLSSARSTAWMGPLPDSMQRGEQYEFPIQHAGPSSQPSRSMHEQQSAYLSHYYRDDRFASTPSLPPPPLAPPYTQGSRVPDTQGYRDSHLELSEHDPAGAPPYHLGPEPARYPYGPDPGSSEFQHAQLAQQAQQRQQQQLQHQQQLQRLRGTEQESSKSVTPVSAPAAASAGASSSRKRKARDEDEDEDEDEAERPRKVSKKTPIACHFCRGRKLKCDGQMPSCSNCGKRGIACQYELVAKRRGPGKAPKGQKKAKAASQPGGARRIVRLRTRPSTDTLPPYTRIPTDTETHLQMGVPRFQGVAEFAPRLDPPPQQMPSRAPPSYEPTGAPHGFSTHLQYPTSTDPGMGPGRVEDSPPRYPESAAAAQHAYGGPYETQGAAVELAQHLPYPPPQEHAHVSGSGTPETWGGARAATTTGLMPESTGREEPHDEGSSMELPHEFLYDEREPAPAPERGPGGVPPTGETPPQ